jgi:hypothetical protein
MSSTGRGPSRIERDDYPTPAWCSRALVRHLGEDKPPSRILEPCAGEGAIVAVLKETWPESHVAAYELDRTRAAVCKKLGVPTLAGDFLRAPVTRNFDLVVTNPPFGAKLLMRIIEKAIGVGTTCALLLPVPWCFDGNGRIEFRRSKPFDVLVLGKRPQFVRHVQCGPSRDEGCGWDDWYAIDGEWPRHCPKCRTKTRSSTSDSTEYCWAIWGPGRGGRWFQAKLDGEEPGPIFTTEET